MELRFPLSDVTIRRVSEVRRVNKPLFGDEYWQISQDEFAMKVDEVGTFYAYGGREIDYSPLPGATEESIHLYLNGSVFGVILYQRGILPMHGSSFAYEEKGVMLCGESGAGKSALTAAFSFDGSKFLTDDVSPIIFRDNIPNILALSDRLKLWNDTLHQLGMGTSQLKSISPDYEKYYFEFDGVQGTFFPLNLIYLLEISKNEETGILELKGSEKFSSLHNEIYRREYLLGMKENEKVFFNHLVDISNVTKIFKVSRPEEIPVKEMMVILKNHMDSILSDG